MTRSRRPRSTAASCSATPVTPLVTLALALALALVAAVPAAATVLPLVEGTTGTARLSVPYPGRSVPFDLTATGRPGASSDLVLLVDGGTGPLASGPHALQLTITDPAGHVVAQGTAAEIAAAPVPLGVLGSEPLRLAGLATLPATAGDDLQGEGMTLRLTLVASQDLPPAPADAGRLAVTGGSVLSLAVVAAALVGAGLLLARRRRAAATVPSTDLPE